MWIRVAEKNTWHLIRLFYAHISDVTGYLRQLSNCFQEYVNICGMLKNVTSNFLKKNSMMQKNMTCFVCNHSLYNWGVLTDW
jgi:hypothetical protein